MFDRIDALERRTQLFAIGAARYVGRLPRTPGVWKIADQLADPRLLAEARELRAIFVRARATTRARQP